MAKKSKLDAVPSAPKPDDEWETKNHARTIIEAHEIMNDPMKMKKVKKHLKTQKKVMRNVDDMIKYRNDKYGPSSSGENTMEDDDSDDTVKV